MSETIIIEANREIAYRDELSSLKTRSVNENFPDFPNNEWRTHIQTGIPLEIGDQISVEATMIQQKGTPEETIEFSGKSNIKNPYGSLDNKAQLDFTFYITNRQQFNCPLPLYNTNVKRLVADASTLNYGLTDVSQFVNFVSAYPYRGIEGMYLDTNTGNYVQVDGGGVFSRPPEPIDDTSPIRFYLMNSNGLFKSYQNADGDLTSTIPDFTRSQVEINIDEGFNTPDNIAQKITEQFHQREGDPSQKSGWDENNVTGSVFSISGQNLVVSGNPLITDKLYKSVATSTGDLLYGRQQGQWQTTFAGESGVEGDNYTEQQGLNFLYKNILCGTPDQFIGSIWHMSLRKNFFNSSNAPPTNTPQFNEAGTYSGDQNIVNGMGQMGCNLCVLDKFDFDTYNVPYTYPTNRLASNTVDNLQVLKMDTQELVVTNAVYNPKNCNYIGIGLRQVKVASSGITPKTAKTDDNQYKYYNAKVQFGRADDFLCQGSSQQKIFLPSHRTIKGDTLTPALPNSYQEISGIKALIGIVNNCRHDAGHKIDVKVFYTDKLNPNNYPNNYSLTLPSTSLFSLTDSRGQYGDFSIAKNSGFAIIPVFYKVANLPSPELIDVPFCALINTEAFAYNGVYNGKPANFNTIPKPAEGEFFGLSPSMYDQLFSKVVSTQKVIPEGDTVYPDHTEPNTRPYSYMPYCMIGADNPQIQYDDNSSRMALTNLHTAVRSGNGIFQEPLEKANDQASVESMCVNTNNSAICGTAVDGAFTPFNKIRQTTTPFPVISSQAGVALNSIFFYNVEGFATNELDPSIPETFSGTIFEKLGFTAEQLIPYVGLRQNQFNRSNYNSVLGNDVELINKYSNMIKPFTTNAYISGADQLSIVKNAEQQQMENLGGTSTNFGTYINAESDELIATNLPSKLDYPYLVVYSDIVRNTKFFGGKNGQQKVPAMAYISRNYSTGDYFYSFSTGWTYTIDTPYILTDFKTQIMLPDGKPAPINKNSSVVYKIIKPMSIPPPLTNFQPKDSEKETKQKTKI
jgi:hypothetical protein